MTAVAFLDTNILLYTLSREPAERAKKAIAIELLDRTDAGLSVQVLQEFYVTVTQKLGKPLSRSDAREIVRDYAQWVATPTTAQTVIRASEISEGWKLSFWDSLILAAAEEQDCSTVLTEDLNSGQTVAGMQMNADHQSVFAKITTFLSDSSVPFPSR